MARVKRAVNAQKKRRVVLERASGYRGQRSRLYRKAKEQVTHSLVYSYNDRRKKKAEAKAEVKAEKVEAAAEKAAEQAEIEAEIKASQTGPAAQKKERKRSENLDPEIEA